MSSHDLEARTFKWTREIAGAKTFEHGMLRVYQDGLTGYGTVFVTSESSPTRVSKDMLHTFDVRAKPAFGAKTKAEGKGYVGLDKYKLTVDRAEWPADTERTEVQDPLELGDFTYGYFDQGDKATIPYVQFPLLDELQRSINQNFDKELDELYRVECATLEDNTFRATVRFHHAATVPLISDSGDDVKTFDVKFPDLGISLTLPCLFQEFYINLDIFGDFSYGALYEFDPDMRGGKGAR
jgi:hypothetical protein